MFLLTFFALWCTVLLKGVEKMSKLNDRISLLIVTLNIKKTAFAERLNVSQAFVSQLCSGTKQPSDRTISDICREFNVSEKWLKSGEGEMFISLTKNQIITDFMGDLIIDEDESFKRRLIEALAKLNPEDWSVLERLAENITKKS